MHTSLFCALFFFLNIYSYLYTCQTTRMPSSVLLLLCSAYLVIYLPDFLSLHFGKPDLHGPGFVHWLQCHAGRGFGLLVLLKGNCNATACSSNFTTTVWRKSTYGSGHGQVCTYFWPLMGYWNMLLGYWLEILYARPITVSCNLSQMYATLNKSISQM